MKDTTLWVGMDVHKESISVSVIADRANDARPTVTIANRELDVRRLFTRLAKEGEVRACYEAGCCGYELHRQLAGMSIRCEVIAPSLIPVRAGDRVKTDRRDAQKLARLYRAGELTAIGIPTPAQEALRDLVRCREDLREELVRQRQQLLKFLLRHGRVFSDGATHWTVKHWTWLKQQRFELPTEQFVFDQYLARLLSTLERVETVDQEIGRMGEQEPQRKTVARLRCLRGIDTLSAVGLVAEVFDFRRFGSANELMAFVGLVPTEHSSGAKQHRGSITKTGNSHIRRLLIEAAWHYRRPPRLNSAKLRRRREGQNEAVITHAKKAQERLHRRYVRLTARGKPSPLAITAVARELCGFVWAIGGDHV